MSEQANREMTYDELLEAWQVSIGFMRTAESNLAVARADLAAARAELRESQNMHIDALAMLQDRMNKVDELKAKVEELEKRYSDHGVFCVHPDAHQDLLDENKLLKHQASEAREYVDDLQANLAMAKEALEKIRDDEWGELFDDAGPIDATPKEKGLFQYVGRVHTRARDALASLKPSEDK